MKLVIMTNIGRHMRERPINYTTTGRICQALFFRHFIQKNRPFLQGDFIGLSYGNFHNFGLHFTTKSVISHKITVSHFLPQGAVLVLVPQSIVLRQRTMPIVFKFLVGRHGVFFRSAVVACVFLCSAFQIVSSANF